MLVLLNKTSNSFADLKHLNDSMFHSETLDVVIMVLCAKIPHITHHHVPKTSGRYQVHIVVHKSQILCYNEKKHAKTISRILYNIFLQFRSFKNKYEYQMGEKTFFKN